MVSQNSSSCSIEWVYDDWRRSLCLCKTIQGKFHCFVIVCWWHILAGNDMEMIITTEGWLSSNFEIKDMGEADYVLGVKILKDRSKKLLGLSQQTYIMKVLKHFQMHNCKPITKKWELKMKKKRWLMFLMLMQLEAWCMQWCVLDLIYVMLLY